jgi:hypothetical protein
MLSVVMPTVEVSQLFLTLVNETNRPVCFSLGSFVLKSQDLQKQTQGGEGHADDPGCEDEEQGVH